jgi:peptide/nickel transport system substrate-binding protein
MVYGIGEGLDKWSLYTSDVKPEASGADKGLKVARMTLFSSQGSLFMSSWDPIGTQGFSDSYTSAVIKECSDLELEANPVTGMYMPLRMVPSKVDTKVERTADGALVGKITVPADAVLWNANTQHWDSGYEYKDVNGDGSKYDYVKSDDITAYSTATYTFKGGKWHDGRTIDMNDYRYASAVQYEIAYKKGADDKVYEPEFANSINPNLLRYKGLVFNKDGTLTSYGDSNYPMDKNYLASLLCPSLMVAGANYGSIVPWEIIEAVKGIVAEGNASNTAYSYNSNGDFTEVDLLSQKCVADLRAKLADFVTEKRVPAPLEGFVTPEQAAKDYQMAIDFIDKHGHAYISNGGFILDRYDAANKTGQLVANRDPSYPYAKGYWVDALATNFARIDGVKTATYKKGVDLTVDVTVSSVAFPSNVATLAPKANVKATLLAANKETTYSAKMAKTGSFQVVMPAKDLAALKAGNYTIVVEASLGSESGDNALSNVIIF